MSGDAVGAGLVRKDGIAKVTGRARYAADWHPPHLAYACAVQSTIAAGNVTGIDDSAARRQRGYLGLMSRDNTPELKTPSALEGQHGQFGEHFYPLQSTEVLFWGQDLAFVIADSLEAAEEAAGLVKVSYEPASPRLDYLSPGADTFEPHTYMAQNKAQPKRGEIQAGLGEAKATLAETYTTSYQNHNPMEPHATVADWGPKILTLYETTQWVLGLRFVVATALGRKPETIRVISPFVGGGFGCKGFVWPHSVFAALASRQVGRPVKLMRTRAQMFWNVGHRGPTRQQIELAATEDGRLVSMRHDTRTATSLKSSYFEPAGVATSILYRCPNVHVRHEVARLNTGSPTPMRAPGEAPGTFALESAMDELAYKLRMDPLEFRLRNYAESDQEKQLPFSSKHLRECYQRGAEAFGWSRRDPRPGSMREAGQWIGWGMATATYPANQRPAEATVTVYRGGRVVVRCCTQDLGTGTYTTLAQVAAQELGIDPGKVSCEIGDSHYPVAGVSGGSSTSASVTPAVQLAARDAAAQLKAAPQADQVTGHGKHAGEKLKDYSAHSFGAQFAAVRVDPRTRQIRVTRVVAVMDAGKILNALTARSQIQGGIVWGISMALLERTELDHRTGAPVTRNLADYLVATNPDVPEITVEFVEHPDYRLNAMGVRGIGEIGITGITGAIANAVFHATGVRVRDLPLTLDRLLV